MSIASELLRLAAAKAAIKQALEDKGLTVSGSLKLDDYAGLISSVQAAPEVYAAYTLDANNQVIAAKLAGVSDIPEALFKELKNMLTVDLPENIVSVGNSAFMGCFALELDAFPAALLTIGASAFHSCYAFGPALVIPAHVTSIGASAFRSCNGVATLWVKGNPVLAGTSNSTGPFGQMGALASAVFGNIGYPMNDAKMNAFLLSSNMKLTSVTVYTAGGAALAAAPFGAIYATITYLSA